jgi:nitrite reductase/ring-hydroxylating ferredoxin subunit
VSSSKPEVFVICSADSIGRGDARAFSLSRVMEDGEARPFPIFVVQTESGAYVGYVNTCPHQNTWLNIGDGTFFSNDKTQLRCGRHKATFEIDTGLCVEGDCKGQSLEPIALAVIDGDLCLCGIQLAEDNDMGFDDLDETMEIMIYPD